MIPWKHQKGMRPYEDFVTTYRSDYRPPSARVKPIAEAVWESAILPQVGCINGRMRGQASVVAGSILPAAGAQEVGVAKETGVLLGEEGKGQLRYVSGGKANMLEQQEANDELQQKIDVLYEEGVIVLFFDNGPGCCEDCPRSVCREAGMQHLLHLPVVSSPIIAIKDAESWDDNLRGLRPVIGLQNVPSLQATFSLTRSLAHVLPAVHRTESSRRPWLTEYQANYNAPWAQPKIQQSALHHRHPPHDRMRYSSH